MNNQVLFKKTALATAMAASVALLSACGGGSDTTASTSDTSVTTTGVITGFGSAVVGSVKYDTDNAVKTEDGKLVELSDMTVGQKCTVVGTIDSNGTTGTAASISCVDEVEGFVLGVTLDVNGDVESIDVMGQTVKVTMDTMFESNTYTSINQIQADDVIEVYGYSDGAGNIKATLIETKDPAALDTDIEVKGLVSSLDDAGFTFMIGSLMVDYSGAGANVPADLADGLYVEVKADNAPDTTGATPVLTATSVEIEDDGDMDIDGESGEELNVTGLVGEMNPVGDMNPDGKSGFMFNGSTFIDYEFVDIEDDFLPTIETGMTLTVEGKIDANGVFIPEEVVEEPETEAETEGYVTSVAEGTVSISTDGGTTVETFTVNADTRMKDELTYDQYFHLLKLIPAESYIEVEYYSLDSGEMIATEVELKAAPAPEMTTAL